MVEIADALDESSPSLKQVSLFVENRLGALQQVIFKLQEHGLQVWAISVVGGADHAVVRLVVDKPEEVLNAFSGHDVFQVDVVGVALHRDRDTGLRRVLSALLAAEVDVHYIYGLVVQWQGNPVIALRVGNTEAAVAALRSLDVTVVDHSDLDDSR